MAEKLELHFDRLVPFQIMFPFQFPFQSPAGRWRRFSLGACSIRRGTPEAYISWGPGASASNVGVLKAAQARFGVTGPVVGFSGT